MTVTGKTVGKNLKRKNRCRYQGNKKLSKNSFRG